MKDNNSKIPGVIVAIVLWGLLILLPGLIMGGGTERFTFDEFSFGPLFYIVTFIIFVAIGFENKD